MKTNVIKTFSDLNSVLNANAGLYTYDYTSGCESNCIHQTIEIELKSSSLCYSGYIYLFKDQEQLNQFILEESNNFDPTAGADDQYYDYNPSQLEAIIWAMASASPEIIEQAKQILLPKLKAFIQDKEQDEDMVTSYQAYLDTLINNTDPRNYQGLEIFSMLTEMTNSNKQ